MKLKFKQTYDNVNDLDYLRCKSSKKQPFDYAMARMLVAQRPACFLPFAFEEESKYATMFYNITGTYRLPEALQLQITMEQLASLFMQVVVMHEQCAAMGFSVRNIVFDPERVYVAQGLQLQFIYLPVTGYESEDRGVLGLLINLAGNARIADPAGQGYAAASLDYFRRQATFSLIDLKHYLGMSSPVTVATSSSEPVARPLRRPSGNLVRDFVAESKGGR